MEGTWEKRSAVGWAKISVESKRKSQVAEQSVQVREEHRDSKVFAGVSWHGTMRETVRDSERQHGTRRKQRDTVRNSVRQQGTM